MPSRFGPDLTEGKNIPHAYVQGPYPDLIYRHGARRNPFDDEFYAAIMRGQMEEMDTSDPAFQELVEPIAEEMSQQISRKDFDGRRFEEHFLKIKEEGDTKLGPSDRAMVTMPHAIRADEALDTGHAWRVLFPGEETAISEVYEPAEHVDWKPAEGTVRIKSLELCSRRPDWQPPHTVKVSMHVDVCTLGLSEAAILRMISISGSERYDQHKKLITIEADQYGSVEENKEHARWILSELIAEAKKADVTQT
jgi:hypothetical protein